MTVTYPPKISLAQLPTPLRHLKRFSSRLNGPQIWLKQDDLTHSMMSGNKVRKLEFVLADALAAGADTLITCGGLQSNHCRATAIAGAQLGLNVHLILRGSMPELADGNHLLDLLAGAAVSVYPAAEYQRNLSSLFAEWSHHYHEQGKTPYLIPTGASNGVGVWGYVAAFEEIIRDCEQAGFTPDAIVCATGSGGTQAGLTLGSTLTGAAIPVIGIAVCDSVDYFEKRIHDDVISAQQLYPHLMPDSTVVERLQIITLDSYIGPGYAQGYPELYKEIASLARGRGLS
jgi:1-aminocyclopropane-1-carboxylate deaminase